jgi:hypothetical protein
VAPSLFQRHHGDPQPQEPCTVLLAGLGSPFSVAAVARAAELARQAGPEQDVPVAVLTIAKVHGTSFGVQHPGLLPNKKERDAQVNLLADAIRDLKRQGVVADGQVAVTRKFLRTILQVARIRQARFVVMDAPPGGRFRRWFEGDPAHYLGPRLPQGSVMEIVAKRLG